MSINKITTNIKKLQFRWQRLLAFFLVLLSCVAISLYLVLTTNAGTRWLLHNASKVITFQTQGVKGNFINGVNIKELQITLADHKLAINDLLLNVDLWPLIFNQTLQVSKLHLSSMQVTSADTLKSGTSDNTIPILPTLPLRVVINDIALNNIVLDSNTPISLSASSVIFNDQSLTLSKAKVSRDFFRAQMNGKLVSTSFQSKLDVKGSWKQVKDDGSLLAEGTILISNEALSRKVSSNAPGFNLRVNHQLSMGPQGGQIFSSGSVNIRRLDDININFDNQITQISGQGWLVSQADIAISGNLDAYSATGSMVIATEQAGEINGSLSAKGPVLGFNTGKINNHELSIDFNTLGGHIMLSGFISPNQMSDGLQSEVVIEGQNISLGQLQSWPLQQPLIANIAAKISVSQLSNELLWTLPELSVSGILGESPFDILAAARGQKNNITLTSLRLRHLDNWINASGSILDNRATLKVNASVKDIGLYSNDNNSFSGNIKIGAAINTLLPDTSDGNNNANPPNWQRDTNIDLSLQSKELMLNKINIGQIDLALTNRGQALIGNINAGFIQSGEMAFENITQTLTGTLSNDVIRLNSQGNGAAIYRGQRLELPSSNTSITWNKSGEQMFAISLHAQNKSLDIKAESKVTRKNNDSSQLGINSDLHISSPDISWLTRLNPHLEVINGSAILNAHIKNEVTKSNIGEWQNTFDLTSHFSVNAPLVTLIDPAISTNQNLIEGEINPDGSFSFHGMASQGEKPIALVGKGRVFGEGSPSINLTINAKELRAHTPKVEIAVSPSLELNFINKQLSVRGTIAIPKADIEVSQLPNADYSHSSDVVILGHEEAVVSSEEGHYDIAVKVLVEKSVLIKAAGLTTKLEGELLYIAISGRQPQLQGKLNLVDGNLSSQSGDLSIKKGSLLFGGSIDNPSVDIIAVRNIDTPALEVGLHITGPLKNLRTEIISIPSIDQTRALSFLVFGRDITQDNGGTNNGHAQLISAALSLGIGQSSGLMQQLKRSTGLDELTAVANDSGSASLIAGKQINPRLYARYRYDMAEALGILLLRYQLTQHWTLEAESGANNSIDVLYRLGE